MINLEHLTEEERKIILDVLKRDDELRQAEEERVKKLKNELYELRRKSAIKVDDEDATAASSKKVCARCREPLGAFINSGEVCPKCQQKVCTNCKVVLPMTKKWLCTICNKQLQIRLESGDAFGPMKEGQAELYGTDLVKASLQGSKLGQDPDVIITSAPLQISPSDSGYNGRIANASSMGESGDLSGGYEDDEDYTSDNSYQQSMLSGVESIGPSVSQRGSVSHQHGLDDHSATRQGKWDDVTLQRIPSQSLYSDEAESIAEEKSKKNAHGNASGKPAAIPTIAIYDAGDAQSDGGNSHTGSWRLRRQAEEGRLFMGSTSSLASLYSTGEEFYGKYPITGDINFGLNYNFKTNVFEIKIDGCRDLVPIDAKRNKSDPYVKTYLLPDKSKNSKRKTKMRKGTINPHYDESLRYNISQSELETRTLSIAVWHYDRFGHNMFLGEVPLSLDAVQFSNYPMKWHQLQARAPASDAKPISYKGDIIIALMFETPPTDENKNANETGTPSKRKPKKGQKSNPVGGTLKVHVKEARNLTAARPNGSANPYVKLYLEPDRSKGGKKKTSVMKNTINPVYEQGFDFPNITEEILKERALEVGIWDHEPVGTSPFMGGIRLGNGTGKSYGREVGWQDSTGVEIQLWDEMLANHNQWVEACLTLRPSLQKDKKT